MGEPIVQAVAGLTPPEVGEATIRTIWPSVSRSPALANLGRLLTATIVLAPLAWLLMAVAYFGKVLPVIGRRYTLTNRRLMIKAGWGGSIVAEIPLANIDEVRLKRDGNSAFFRAADLEILHHRDVALTLLGVPDPEAFRETILNARNAWVPRMASRLPFIAASAVP